MAKKKQTKKSKINITSTLGVLGATSGLATGAFLLFAELNKCYETSVTCPTIYEPYEIWKVISLSMFLLSVLSWTGYLICTKRNNSKKK